MSSKHDPVDVESDSEEKKELFPFHEMCLDDRILKAIAKLGWINPTLIQERAIPLILEGKDLLARGRTGSGKTGAFCIPMIQRILEVKTNSSSSIEQVNLVFFNKYQQKESLLNHSGCARLRSVSQS